LAWGTSSAFASLPHSFACLDGARSTQTHEAKAMPLLLSLTKGASGWGVCEEEKRVREEEEK
tara:strand:- start:145 stop:330 length:186 start_codon:yes stop_codon:yes gene_type:complete